MDLQLTIDCVNPVPMVAFWSVALDYEPAPPPEENRIRDPQGEGIRIWFQTVPEKRAPGKNRLHLDLYPGGGRAVERALRRTAIQERIAALLELGGTILRTFPDDFPDAPDTDDWFCTMTDPEGNEFCVS